MFTLKSFSCLFCLSSLLFIWQPHLLFVLPNGNWNTSICYSDVHSNKFTKIKSLMNMTNSRGPCTYPCCAPLFTDIHLNSLQLITTLCLLPTNITQIQDATYLLLPCPAIFVINILCGTWSKAYLRSRSSILTLNRYILIHCFGNIFKKYK